MGAPSHSEPSGWQRIDQAAVGIICGAITVLSILMANDIHPEETFKPAIVLFGSVLALTLAKTFAEIMAHSLDTGKRAAGHTLWAKPERRAR